MSERRTIGQILVSVGRITEEDVAQALAYQRDNGGYFGEALLACDLATADELEWCLASQFDLPYLFPEADAVDPEAAALVSPEWALSHLTLPIMKTADSLKVVVDSPLKTEPIDELREMTDLRIELGLASPTTIRELIRQVYARGSASDEPNRTPMTLAGALEAIFDAGAARFGISSRGARSHVWWDDRGTVRRRPLAGDWRADLDAAMSPGPSTVGEGETRADWEAEFDLAGVAAPVEARYMADGFSSEYLFRPLEVSSALDQRYTPPAEGIVSEIRLLARSGTARFVVTTDPPDLGRDILPLLPTFVLDPAWRSIYLTASPEPADHDALTLTVTVDPGRWDAEIDALRAFHFDAVSVDMEGGGASWAEKALDIASVAFLLWPRGGRLQDAWDAGIRWHLRIERGEDDHLAWSLDPLHPTRHGHGPD